MKESYKERLATHFGPESCAVARKSNGEALTGVRAGRVLSCEIHAPARKRWVLRSADVLEQGGRPYRARRYRETRLGSAQSQTPRMYGNISHGNREIPALSGKRANPDRIGKSKDERR
jgi:RNA-directed DNA polymerase